MFRLKVDVTPELIHEVTASRDSDWKYSASRDCLMSQALTRAMGRKISTCFTRWYNRHFDSVASNMGGMLPESAKNAIKRFDGRREVAPFQFEVTPQSLSTWVSPEMIDEAVANRNSNSFNSITDCPFSIALKAMLPNERIYCGTTSVFINNYEYEVDRRAANIIVRYMERKPIDPFFLSLTLKCDPEGKPCSP